MTNTPEEPQNPQDPAAGATPPSAPAPPPPYGAPAPGNPTSGNPTPGYQAPPPPAPPSGYPPGYQAPYGAVPGAPYGVDPKTGLPYSDKSKLVAGLLQILIPFGIGRFYIGDTNMGIAQLLVTIFTCGLGGLWPFIDGIIILATDSKDSNGYPLKPS